MDLSPKLATNVWQMIHAMANGQRFALHAERQAIAMLEAALQKATEEAEAPQDGTT